MECSSFSVLGIPFYRRKAETGKTTYYVLGIPIIHHVLNESFFCTYFMGIPIAKKAIKNPYLTDLSRKKKSEAPELLIVAIDHIGDYILLRNYFRALKETKKFASHKIVLMGSESYKSFAMYLDSDIVDHFIWSTDRIEKMPSCHIERLRRQMHERQGLRYFYDVILCVSGNTLTLASKAQAYNSLLSKVSSNEKFVYWGNEANPRSEEVADYSAVIRGQDYVHRHEFERYRLAFENIAGEKLPVIRPSIDISASPSSGLEPYMVIHPCASNKWRMWHCKNWASLIAKIKGEYGIKIIIICADEELQYVKMIKEETDLRGVTVQVAAGLQVADLLALIRNARLFVGTDSGIFHIAVALGQESVCISACQNYFRYAKYPPGFTNVRNVVPKELEDYVVQKAGADPLYEPPQYLPINAVRVDDAWDIVRECMGRPCNDSSVPVEI